MVEMSYLTQLFNLTDRVAVVTGGLGILGTEYSKALAEAGASIAIFDLKEPQVDHELVAYSKKYPLRFYKVDITQRAEVEEAYKNVVGDLGSCEVLINNAAIDFPPKSRKVLFEDYPLEEWEAVLKANLTGALICSQVIGGDMARLGKGSIINISSVYGILSPDQRIYENFLKPVSYSVSKAGILNLTRYLATYWAEKNVRVNTLTLGGVQGNQAVEFVKKYQERVPLGRMAKKNDYVGAVLFLASDASSYMTGSNLIIDGGMSAW